MDSPARPSRSPILQSICSELGRLFKRTGSRNPKLIGSDNSFLNEAIPEAVGSSLGQKHPSASRATHEQDRTHLSQLFYRIEDGQSFAPVAPPTRPFLRWEGHDYCSGINDNLLAGIVLFTKKCRVLFPKGPGFGTLFTASSEEMDSSITRNSNRSAGCGVCHSGHHLFQLVTRRSKLSKVPIQPSSHNQLSHPVLPPCFSERRESHRPLRLQYLNEEHECLHNLCTIHRELRS